MCVRRYSVKGGAAGGQCCEEEGEISSFEAETGWGGEYYNLILCFAPPQASHCDTHQGSSDGDDSSSKLPTPVFRSYKPDAEELQG